MSKHFKLIHQSNQGRRGVLSTPHGEIQTPFFMPIATKGAVKTLTPEELRMVGASILLSNTYHLNLRPGTEILQAAGGLHGFMGWNGPMLTDSGGYQVFSLGKIRTIAEDGVRFRSHLDGREFFLSPEESIRIQQVIGSDIMMCLDECLSPNAAKKEVEQSIGLTFRWGRRCKRYVDDRAEDGTMNGALLFGIVQGGVFEDLRQRSVEEMCSLDFDGYAIGGLAVGETEEEMMEMTSTVASVLPVDQPRYFMGGARPEQLVELVRRGMDMFDCVIPTRNGRHGKLFAWNDAHHDIFSKSFYHELNISNQAFAKDFSPLDPTCDCVACQTTTRAYLRHLFVVEDPLAWRFATIHNLRFYLLLMERLRLGITS